MSQIKFVAEVCSNHNQDLDRALRLIEVAADIGCQAVKFQLFRLDKMFAPELLSHPDYTFVRERKNWELPLEWLPALREKCNEVGLKFGCTPFHLEAIGELLPYVDFFKVASYEVGWKELIERIAATDKPLLISCGLHTIDEIRRAFGWYRKIRQVAEGLTLLHCVSQYPAELEQCNLLFINRLRHEFFGLDGIGYSDHSVRPGVIHKAIQYGAQVIEFHLDLEDGQGFEYDIGHCWLPSQIAPVIAAVRDGEAATGSTYIDVNLFEDRAFRRDRDGLRPMAEIREKLGGHVRKL